MSALLANQSSTQHRIRDKRIVLPFLPERAHRAVAGDEPHAVAKGPEILHDAINQLLVIAFREICPADRAAKQHIANKSELALLVIDHDMARRVAGAMGDAEGLAAESQRVALLEIAIGLDILAIGNAIARALFFNLVEQPLIILVRANDRAAGALFDGGGGAGMVEMAMGQPDRDDLDAKLLGGGHQPVNLTAGINEHAFHGLAVPDQRGVLLERRDGNDADVELRLRGFWGLLIGHGL